MTTKKFGADFTSAGGALTLPSSSVVDGTAVYGVIYQRTHESGWTIKGEVHSDYYEWVNDFEATHPKFGKVAGNFEGEVIADSEEGFAHFWKHHQPQAWNYGDI